MEKSFGEENADTNWSNLILSVALWEWCNNFSPSEDFSNEAEDDSDIEDEEDEDNVTDAWIRPELLDKNELAKVNSSFHLLTIGIGN